MISHLLSLQMQCITKMSNRSIQVEDNNKTSAADSSKTQFSQLIWLDHVSRNLASERRRYESSRLVEATKRWPF